MRDRERQTNGEETERGNRGETERAISERQKERIEKKQRGRDTRIDREHTCGPCSIHEV